MSTRPPFRQVAAPLEVDDKILKELNQKLHVPTLVKSPQRKATPDRVAPAPPPPTAVESSKPAKVVRSDVRLAVEVPPYLRDAVNVRAAQDRCTSRHIVMLGLQAIGFEIEEADFAVDGRQLAGKR